MKNIYTFCSIILLVFMFLNLFSSDVISNIVNKKLNIDHSKFLKEDSEISLKEEDCENKIISNFDLNKPSHTKYSVLKRKRSLDGKNPDFFAMKENIFFSSSEKNVQNKIFGVLFEQEYLQLKKYNFSRKIHIDSGFINNNRAVLPVCSTHAKKSIILSSKIINPLLLYKTKYSIFWPTIELEHPLEIKYSQNQTYFIIDVSLQEKIVNTIKQFRYATKPQTVANFIDSMDCRILKKNINGMRSPIYYENFCLDILIKNRSLYFENIEFKIKNIKKLEKFKCALKSLLMSYYLKEKSAPSNKNEKNRNEELIKTISNKFETLYFGEFLKICMQINHEYSENNRYKYGYILLLCIDNVQINYINDIYKMCSRDEFSIPSSFIKNQDDAVEEKQKYLAKFAQSRKIILRKRMINKKFSTDHIQKYFMKEYLIQIKTIFLDMDSKVCINHNGVFLYN